MRSLLEKPFTFIVIPALMGAATLAGWYIGRAVGSPQAGTVVAAAAGMAVGMWARARLDDLRGPQFRAPETTCTSAVDTGEHWPDGVPPQAPICADCGGAMGLRARSIRRWYSAKCFKCGLPDQCRSRADWYGGDPPRE